MPSLTAAAAEAKAAYQHGLGRKPVLATSLFFVAHRDDADSSYDLLVEAASAEEAITLWRGYYELGDDARPDSVFTVPALTGASRALSWHGDVREVAGTDREEVCGETS